MHVIADKESSFKLLYISRQESCGFVRRAKGAVHLESTSWMCLH